jgi:flagellar basal-body rod protein FlgG
MLEGMYSAAAGMTAQQQRLDALSNDLANVSTTGYKKQRVAFRDLVYTPSGLATAGMQEGAGAAATSIGRTSAQGALKETGEPLDVAISGPGWLLARGARGEQLLTRDGDLQLDEQGRLSTRNGLLLDPPVRVPAGTQPDQVGIGPDGTVTVAGAAVGRLRLVSVAAPAGLRSVAENAFAPTPESGPVRAADPQTTLRAGALEASNVDMAGAMAEMIEAQRAFELASRAIHTQDRAQEIANGVKR